MHKDLNICTCEFEYKCEHIRCLVILPHLFVIETRSLRFNHDCQWIIQSIAWQIQKQQMHALTFICWNYILQKHKYQKKAIGNHMKCLRFNLKMHSTSRCSNNKIQFSFSAIILLHFLLHLCLCECVKLIITVALKPSRKTTIVASK